MILNVALQKNSYDIVIERGALRRAGEIFSLSRKVLVVTDSGVPRDYAETVAKQCKSAKIVTVEQGEGAKSFPVFERLCRELLEGDFTRSDCVVAVGGGVVGDLAGFAAASYMRGIDFYNVPTTLLAQVDSSIGGKVAINLASIKNIVGAFYQPCGVLIDPNVLSTLPPRHISNGLAEALKMAMTCDGELFSLLEENDPKSIIDTVIERSLMIKKSVVEQDERENGIRKILNFGHTVGHGIESSAGLSSLLHGECVALGMIPMCSKEARERLVPLLKKLGLCVEIDYDTEKIIETIKHDKKLSGDKISLTFVEKIGEFELVTLPFSEFSESIRKVFEK